LNRYAKLYDFEINRFSSKVSEGRQLELAYITLANGRWNAFYRFARQYPKKGEIVYW
jgi:hypothetical protein